MFLWSGQQFPAIYLPSVAILSDREVGLLDEYVSAGGNLLVTGITDYTIDSSAARSIAIAKIIGANLVCIQEIIRTITSSAKKLSTGPAEFFMQNVPATG
jgi:hypothetical protein